MRYMVIGVLNTPNTIEHRDYDLPVVIFLNGYKAWYKNDCRHRGNSKPAIIHPDGHKKYWVNGKQLSNETL